MVSTNGRKHRIPKTFGDSLIRKLNAACSSTQCELECSGLGWCAKCWEKVRYNRGEVCEMKRKGCGK